MGHSKRKKSKLINYAPKFATSPFFLGKQGERIPTNYISGSILQLNKAGGFSILQSVKGLGASKRRFTYLNKTIDTRPLLFLGPDAAGDSAQSRASSWHASSSRRRDGSAPLKITSFPCFQGYMCESTWPGDEPVVAIPRGGIPKQR